MSPEDPYLPPASDSSAPPAVGTAELVSASHAARLANLVVDTIIVIAVTIISHDILLNIGEPSYLSSAAFYFIYYFAMEGLASRTIGKLATGTKVVNVDGGRLTVSQHFTRTLMRFLPFEPFSFLGQEPEGWHDTFSRSFVVKSR